MFVDLQKSVSPSPKQPNVAKIEVGYGITHLSRVEVDEDVSHLDICVEIYKVERVLQCCENLVSETGEGDVWDAPMRDCVYEEWKSWRLPPL